MDWCLFDWIREGKNPIEKNAEDEAYRQAKYRIVVPQSRVPGAGAYFVDLLSAKELFIMDIGLSQIPIQVVYATRTPVLDDRWCWTSDRQ